MASRAMPRCASPIPVDPLSALQGRRRFASRAAAIDRACSPLPGPGMSWIRVSKVRRTSAWPSPASRRACPSRHPRIPREASRGRSHRSSESTTAGREKADANRIAPRRRAYEGTAGASQTDVRPLRATASRWERRASRVDRLPTPRRVDDFGKHRIRLQCRPVATSRRCRDVREVG